MKGNNKGLSKLTKVFIAIVCAVAAIMIVTALIPVKPLEAFGEYDRVVLMASSSGNEYGSVIVDGVDANAAALKEGLDDSSFSVLQWFTEFKVGKTIKAKTNVVDGKDEHVKISASEIASYGSLEGQYVIKFYFDEIQTAEFDGVTVKYDRILLRISDSNGEIGEMDIIPYLDMNVGNMSSQSKYDENGFIGSFYYETNVFSVQMKTSLLMNKAKEIMSM